MASLPLPTIREVKEVIPAGDDLYLITPDPMAGRRHTYSVTLIDRTRGRTACVGRELNLSHARAVVQRVTLQRSLEHGMRKAYRSHGTRIFWPAPTSDVLRALRGLQKKKRLCMEVEIMCDAGHPVWQDIESNVANFSGAECQECGAWVGTADVSRMFASLTDAWVAKLDRENAADRK